LYARRLPFLHDEEEQDTDHDERQQLTELLTESPSWRQLPGQAPIDT
jgi:hypothetical protein